MSGSGAPESVDILVLNSGEWLLEEELAANPWRLLIYRQRGEPRNELHLWLPRQGPVPAEPFAFRRYWMHGGERWCVEALPGHGSGLGPAVTATRIRFTSSAGRVLWAPSPPAGLADLSGAELEALVAQGTPATFSGL